MGSDSPFLTFLRTNYSRVDELLEGARGACRDVAGDVNANGTPAPRRHHNQVLGIELTMSPVKAPPPICTIAIVALMMAACSGPRPTPPPATGPEAAPPPVVRTPLPEPQAAAPSPTLAPPPSLPSGAIYVCVVEKKGERQQTAIEFPSPKVRDLCRMHPEMGPCQYERQSCRRSGGRVFAANGAEITAQTEAEYDKKVLRVRFKSN